MNVLTVGSDRKLFVEHSAVSKRIIEYASAVGPMHIIVFSLKKHNLESKKLGSNVWLYPTNSLSKWFYIHDAVAIAKRAFVFGTKFSIDVVSTQDPFESGLAGYHIARALKRPLQLQVHTEPFSNGAFRKSLFNLVRLFLARFLFKKATCVRVVAQSTKDYLEKKYTHLRGKIAVLPIFVDIDYLRAAEPSFDLHAKYPQFTFITLMASRLTKEKNIPFALEVFKDVVKEFPKAGLVLVGSGPIQRRIERHARRLGIANNVVIEPWQGDLVPYYKGANLFLHTSCFEGFGMVLVEAAACGLPIVSSNVGVAPKLAEEGMGATVCPISDKSCFVEEIISFIKDNARREFSRLQSQDGLDAVLPATKEEYLKAYREALEQCSNKK